MNIVILGSGNVATLLGIALFKAGYDIKQVWSRNKMHAEALANLLHTSFTNDIRQIDSSADLYLISISDDAIPSLMSKLNSFEGIVVHTSGSTSIHIFKNKFSRYGVFYPIQTFSKEREADLKKTPILLEASDPKTYEALKLIALSISDHVQQCSSDQRRTLHLAAVFACNFTNHLYTIAQSLLEANQLDFDLLRPLIAETALKVQKLSPNQVQTGPAVRNDLITINSHLKQLENQPGFLEIYRLLSEQIISSTSKN